MPLAKNLLVLPAELKVKFRNTCLYREEEKNFKVFVSRESKLLINKQMQSNEIGVL